MKLGPQHYGVMFWYRPARDIVHLVSLSTESAQFATRNGYMTWPLTVAEREVAELPAGWKWDEGSRSILRPASAEEVAAL